MEREKRRPVIAVDFDGTIVTHKYPQIGEELEGAFSTLKDLQEAGFIIDLWTIRDGDLLDEAVNFCKEHGIEFHAINNNEPKEEFLPKYMSRKIFADYYIDDRNIGGFIGWNNIRKILLPGTEKQDPEPETPVKKKWWKR